MGTHWLLRLGTAIVGTGLWMALLSLVAGAAAVRDVALSPTD